MTTELTKAAQQALEVLKSATSFMSKKARDQHPKTVARLERALTTSQPAPGVPEGFALVPVEPTPQMTTLVEHDMWDKPFVNGADVWSAVLAAAQAKGADPEDLAAAGVMLMGRRTDHA